MKVYYSDIFALIFPVCSQEITSFHSKAKNIQLDVETADVYKIAEIKDLMFFAVQDDPASELVTIQHLIYGKDVSSWKIRHDKGYYYSLTCGYYSNVTSWDKWQILDVEFNFPDLAAVSSRLESIISKLRLAYTGIHFRLPDFVKVVIFGPEGVEFRKIELNTVRLFYDQTFDKTLLCPLTRLKEKQNLHADEIRFDIPSYMWLAPSMRMQCPQCQALSLYGSNISVDNVEFFQFKCPQCCIYYSVCVACHADAINRRSPKVQLMQLKEIENRRGISSKCTDYKIVAIDYEHNREHEIEYTNHTNRPYRQSVPLLEFHYNDFDSDDFFDGSRIVFTETIYHHDEKVFDSLADGGWKSWWYCSLCNTTMELLNE